MYCEITYCEITYCETNDCEIINSETIYRETIVKLSIAKLSFVKLFIVKISIVNLFIMKLSIVKLCIVKLAIKKLSIVKLFIVKLSTMKNILLLFSPNHLMDHRLSSNWRQTVLSVAVFFSSFHDLPLSFTTVSKSFLCVDVWASVFLITIKQKVKILALPNTSLQHYIGTTPMVKVDKYKPTGPPDWQAFHL